MTAVESADKAPVCPFDHHDPNFRFEFRDVLREIRETAPIIRSESHGGFWVATDYPTVRKIAQDSETFTVAPGPDRTGGLRIPTPAGLKTRPLFVPGETDGDEHDMYRLALNPHFSKARVNEIEPMIQGHVNRVVDAALAQGQFDAIDDLIIPILAAVAAEHLGLKVEEPRVLFRHMHEMISSTSSKGESFAEVKARFENSWQQIEQLVKDRRAEPLNDVVSALVQHPDPVFTNEQVEMMVLNIILGAFHTTASLMGQIVVHLDDAPELREYIRNNKDGMSKVVDEFLRLKAVSIGIARTATKDVHIAGADIKEGDRILIMLAGANHDPNKYANPTEFDLERGAGQHLGMGVGTHFCLGAWLAKSIAANLLHTVYSQVENLKVDHDGIELAPEISNAYGLEHVPVTVVPRAES